MSDGLNATRNEYDEYDEFDAEDLQRQESCGMDPIDDDELLP